MQKRLDDNGRLGWQYLDVVYITFDASISHFNLIYALLNYWYLAGKLMDLEPVCDLKSQHGRQRFAD
ncbi:hypothetical protein HanIR_Chr13g0620041 [Helianthus annuus]|nr:hypothetical protein HanIR_Chr13g0620041 [Helianthus annuus]